MTHRTRYARSGDLNIAYQVVGDAPRDLVVVPGFVSHLEHAWEEPSVVGFWNQLASFSRMINFDKRGTGLSDRTSDLPTLEERMDDIRAVMDASESQSAAIFGLSEGVPLAIMFAATHPMRTTALVLYGGMARYVEDDDYPWAPPRDIVEMVIEGIPDMWGEGLSLESFAPSAADDQRLRDWYARLERLGASPGAAQALARMNLDIDVRAILPTIGVPTLVLHRRGDMAVNVGSGRYLAEHIPGAKYVELEGIDHIPFLGDSRAVLEEVQEFLTGVRPVEEPDRLLATVLFTDIVDSTRLASELGDRRWKETIESHDALVRTQLDRFRGREVKTTGDGFHALFDGPARGIRCAQSIVTGCGKLGINVRAGLHTGECLVVGGDVAGLAVHIAARVAAMAAGGEVMASGTVKDLVAGSGIRFADRGVHELKGVPDEWRIFRVENGD